MTATALRPKARATARAGRLRRHPRLALAGLVLLLLGAGAAYLLLYSPVTVIKAVQVTGTREVSASAVRKAAAVEVGTPMIRLDRAAVSARIRAALANVASVSVQRSWPSTVRLVVHERVVAVVVPQDGQFLLVDRTGVGFRLTRADPPGTITAALANPGPDDAPTRAALAVLAGLPADVRALVQQVQAPTQDQVTLVLRDRRQILWGGAEDGRAKAAVVQILLKRKGRYLDVSAPGLVTVR